MRTALRLIGTRNGIALVLVVLVLAVIGGGRLMTGSKTQDAVGPIVSPPTTSTPSDSDVGDDSAVEPSDSGPGPSLSAGTPSVTTVASHFINAWLKHANVTGDQWRAALAPNVTTALMTKLQDTDPGSVPADTVVGKVVATDEGGSVWSATVPVNGGTVTLRVIATLGRWQVDGIDWDPS